MNSVSDRRHFILRSGSIAVGTLVGGILLSPHRANAHELAGEFYQLSTDTEGKCGTCEYWGGLRKVAEDKKSVLIQSLGWCNNSKSPHYQQLTTPETGPMASWKKWGVLGES